MLRPPGFPLGMALLFFAFGCGFVVLQRLQLPTWHGPLALILTGTMFALAAFFAFTVCLGRSIILEPDAIVERRPWGLGQRRTPWSAVHGWSGTPWVGVVLHLEPSGSLAVSLFMEGFGDLLTAIEARGVPNQ